MMQPLKQKPTELGLKEYLEVYGDIYEHNPWIAEAAYAGAHDTVEELHQDMMKVLEKATDEQKLTLIKAHPQLACAQGDLSQASTTEQAGAGLDQCTAEEFEQFRHLNKSYWEKFGFPFIIAVRGLDKSDILTAFKARIFNERAQELAIALEQINRIALLRLKELGK